MNNRPAADDLNLVLAGMAGTDGVSFEGAAALLFNGRALEDSALYYGGKVEDHNKVSLYSLLPDGGEGLTAAEKGVTHLNEESSAGTTFYTRLEKKNGEWALLNTEAQSAERNPLPALNPLRQLEELQDSEKTVTKGSGAPRGTEVLRIELSEAEAIKQLNTELNQEMEAIRPGQVNHEGQAGGSDDGASEALLTFWEQKDRELKQKLEQASVKAVYYLKVDAKRNLPRRLTLTRTISYPGSEGRSNEETYVTQVDFYGYR